MSARLQRLKSRLTDIAKKIDDVLELADKEDRGLTEAEQTSVDALQKQSDSLQGLLAVEQNADKARNVLASLPKAAQPKQVKSADPVEETEAEADEPTEQQRQAPETPRKRDTAGLIAALNKAGNPLRIKSVKPEIKGMDIGTMLAVTGAGILRAKALPGTTAYDHIEGMGYGQWAETLYDNKIKALSTGTVGSGAEVMPEVFSQQFIAYLHPLSAILRSNPVRIDLSTGNLRISGGDAGATASYRAEGTDIGYTEQTFREMNMTAKNLGAISAVNNELLQRSPMAVAEIIRTEMATAFALRMDLAGLRGDGTSNTPTGARYLANAGNVLSKASMGVAPTVTALDAFAIECINKMQSVNLIMIRPTWIMNTYTANYLRQLRAGSSNDGQKVFPEMDSETNPKWWGYPVTISNQVPSNLGVGTNESEVYLVDMGHYWLGDTEQMQLAMSEEATYNNGGLISAFSRNQTVMRLTGAHDFATRYDKSIVVATGVKWGR